VTKPENPFAALSRANLSQYVTRTIHEGRGFQSSVFLVEMNGQRAAVKDYSRAPRKFRRFVAPLLISREVKALRALESTPGVPRLVKKIDRLAFAMEFIDGTPIADFEEGALDPQVFPRVQKVIDAIHAKGVSHCDLKRRSNLVVTPEGEIYLVDFAAAVVGKKPLRFFNNWFQKKMAEIDDKSLPRIKKFAAPEMMTPDDWDKLNNKTFLEKLARKLLNR
jgi:predicted Ser/Thr protein kinase